MHVYKHLLSNVYSIVLVNEATFLCHVPISHWALRVFLFDGAEKCIVHDKNSYSVTTHTHRTCTEHWILLTVTSSQFQRKNNPRNIGQSQRVLNHWSFKLIQIFWNPWKQRRILMLSWCDSKSLRSHLWLSICICVSKCHFVATCACTHTSYFMCALGVLCTDFCYACCYYLNNVRITFHYRNHFYFHTAFFVWIRTETAHIKCISRCMLKIIFAS